MTFGATKIHADGISFLSFGRLRPLHTNTVLSPFAGNMIFGGGNYSTQRLCKARTASLLLSQIHFWGWQLMIVAATIRQAAAQPKPRQGSTDLRPVCYPGQNGPARETRD